jgi:Single-strand binding protein family
MAREKPTVSEDEVLSTELEAETSHEAAEFEEKQAVVRPPKSRSYSKKRPADNEGHSHWDGDCLHIEGQIVREDPDKRMVGVDKGIPLCTFYFGKSGGRIAGTEPPQYKPWLWLDVEIWRDLGVQVYENFRKGDRVALKGKLEYRERMHEGKKYTNWVLIADYCHLIIPEEVTL